MRAAATVIAFVVLGACGDRRLVDELDDGEDESAGGGGGGRCSYHVGAGEVVVLHEAPFLAVDETGSIIVDECRAYWTMQEGEIGGEVDAMGHGGGEVERLAANLVFVHALALSGERLFFADQRGVHVTPTDASAAATLILPYDDYPIDVAADHAYVYVATPDGVLRMPIGGGDPETIVPTAATLVAVADDTLVLRSEDALIALELATFEPTTLATVMGEVWDMSVGEDSIYLAKGERITSVPRDGGAEETLIAGGLKISTLVVDARYVYWTDFGIGAIYAADLETADILPLAEGVAPVGVAIDEHSVFWTTTQPGRVSRRAKP